MKYFCTENQRKGTCYHEFQKGRFDRERFGSFDFWKDDSLLLHDDVLEETQLWKLFSAVLEGYDPLGIVEVTPLQWDAVCREARRAGGVWQEAIEEASPWVDATFREHAVFTILGI